MSEKKDKSFLSTVSWNPIRIRKISQGSKSTSETQSVGITYKVMKIELKGVFIMV